MSDDINLIHTEGLEEEIACAMCTNPIKSDRGCDGNCSYDDYLYRKILEVIEKRMVMINNGERMSENVYKRN